MNMTDFIGNVILTFNNLYSARTIHIDLHVPDAFVIRFPADLDLNVPEQLQL